MSANTAQYLFPSMRKQFDITCDSIHTLGSANGPINLILDLVKTEVLASRHALQQQQGVIMSRVDDVIAKLANLSLAKGEAPLIPKPAISIGKGKAKPPVGFTPTYPATSSNVSWADPMSDTEDLANFASFSEADTSDEGWGTVSRKRKNKKRTRESTPNPAPPKRGRNTVDPSSLQESEPSANEVTDDELSRVLQLGIRRKLPANKLRSIFDTFSGGAVLGPSAPAAPIFSKKGMADAAAKQASKKSKALPMKEAKHTVICRFNHQPPNSARMQANKHSIGFFFPEEFNKRGCQSALHLTDVTFRKDCAIALTFTAEPNKAEFDLIGAIVTFIYKKFGAPEDFAIETEVWSSTKFVDLTNIRLRNDSGALIPMEELERKVRSAAPWLTQFVVPGTSKTNGNPQGDRLLPFHHQPVATRRQLKDGETMGVLRISIRDLRSDAVSVKFDRRANRKRSFQIDGQAVRITFPTLNTRVPQCQKCLLWGHTQPKCPPSNKERCSWCGGPHRRDTHNALGCCHKGLRSNATKDPNVGCLHEPRCLNCSDSHEATSLECAFFKKRENFTWHEAHTSLHPKGFFKNEPPILRGSIAPATHTLPKPVFTLGDSPVVIDLDEEDPDDKMEGLSHSK